VNAERKSQPLSFEPQYRLQNPPYWGIAHQAITDVLIQATDCPNTHPLINGSKLHVIVEFWNKLAKEREVFPLAITRDYSQGAGGRAPLDAGALLAHNGNMIGYSQYFPHLFEVLAGEVGERIIRL
jgi:hypothetical protein